jgi:hypothetical protein
MPLLLGEHGNDGAYHAFAMLHALPMPWLRPSWQEHVKTMSRAWQDHVNNMAIITWQYIGNNVARASPEHGHRHSMVMMAWPNHALDTSLPCSCHAIAMPLSCSSLHALAMARMLPSCLDTSMSTQIHRRAAETHLQVITRLENWGTPRGGSISMYHSPATHQRQFCVVCPCQTPMLLPCYCQALVMCLPCSWHVLGMFLPCSWWHA